MKNPYLWSIPIAFSWPLIQILLFVIRFGHLSVETIRSSLIFLPMGFLSAIILIYLFERAESRNRKACTIFGYVLAGPFALLGSLFSGLLFAPVIGTLIYGTIPLLIGTMVGYVIGGILKTQEPA